MIFKYREASPRVFRPLIEILLTNDAKFVIYTALVDSGADYCIFGKELADALGIKLSTKNKTKLIGIARTPVIGYWGSIKIRIGTYSYEAKVIFASIHDFGYGVLGQLGFFDHFDVCLSYQKKEIGIKPKTSRRGGKPLIS